MTDAPTIAVPPDEEPEGMELVDGLAWIGGGGLLVGLAIAMAALSREFAWDVHEMERPVVEFVALYMAMGATALALFGQCWRKAPRGWGWVAWVFVVGLAMRGVMFGSVPILEVDFYRYLFDGAATANGLNPYQVSPEAAQSEDHYGDAWNLLSALYGERMERINHPELRTIYPPVAQGAFALASHIDRFSLEAWRAVLLGADVVTFAGLVALLIALGRSPCWAMVYWWNPLVVKEIFNAGHMDAVALPFVVWAVFLSVKYRSGVMAGVMLALAVGAKLWPVLLGPIWLVRGPGPAWRRAVGAAVGAGVLAVLAIPVIEARPWEADSGFSAFAGSWQNNDLLFSLQVWLAEYWLPLIGQPSWAKYQAARWVTGVLVAAWVAALCWKKPTDDAAWVARLMLAVGGAYLLLPTQFPWYFTWVLPLLCVAPRPSLLLYTMLLPLYYLGYYFVPRGDEELMWAVVAVQHVPVVVLFVVELLVPWWLRRVRAGELKMAGAFIE